MRKAPLTLINLKVSKADRARLNAVARLYTGGNVSLLLRLAGMAYKPAKRRRKAQ